MKPRTGTFTNDLWTVAFIVTALVALFGWPGQRATTARQAERNPAAWVTKQWDIPLTDAAGFLRVIDTAGVCVYVYNQVGIAAVPKAQLPPGAGCQ